MSSRGEQSQLDPADQWSQRRIRKFPNSSRESPGPSAAADSSGQSSRGGEELFLLGWRSCRHELCGLEGPTGRIVEEGVAEQRASRVWGVATRVECS